MNEIEDDSILPNPRWDYFKQRLLGSPDVSQVFFESVNPVLQNKFLLSIREKSISMMVDSFSEFKSAFTQQQLELIRYALIDCSFDASLFFPENTTP